MFFFRSPSSGAKKESMNNNKRLLLSKWNEFHSFFLHSISNEWIFNFNGSQFSMLFHFNILILERFVFLCDGKIHGIAWWRKSLPGLTSMLVLYTARVRIVASSHDESSDSLPATSAPTLWNCINQTKKTPQQSNWFVPNSLRRPIPMRRINELFHRRTWWLYRRYRHRDTHANTM